MSVNRRLLGLEHEFQVFDSGGERLDMSALIDTLAFDGMRLDPGDPHAVRLTHGGVITADGREAEIATPPIEWSPTALGTLTAHSSAALDDLRRALGDTRRLEGYSTHLNVSCAERRCTRTADRLARRWAPALMLLTMRVDSPGLLVRPRWRRLELGCEFLPDHFWQPALAFTAGAVAAAERRADRSLAEIDVVLTPSTQRFGWYIDRAAFGADLLGGGRSTQLRGRDGSVTTGHDVLHAAWHLVRAAVDTSLPPEVVEQLDAMVAGDLPLPCESDACVEAWPAAQTDGVVRLPLTYAVNDHAVRPCAFTWRRAVFEITGPNTSRWIEVDGTELQAFYRALHAGRLDDALLAGRRRLHY